MIRIGIIGSGFGLYGLLPAFRSLEECEVVAISGKKTERVRAYCESIRLKKIYKDWKVMLETEKLDAVAIAMPPRIQYEIAMTAMEKGLHVFAEKPLAASTQQAQELKTRAEEKNVVTTVDFIFPEIQAWQTVKHMLEEETYGRLQHMSVDWDFQSYDLRHGIVSWKTDVTEGGGALSFYFSHVLYYIEYFAGKIDVIKSKFTHSSVSLNGGEVGVDIEFRSASGMTGYAHIDANNKELYRHRLTFECTDATIILESSEGITSHFAIRILTAGNDSKIPVIRDSSRKEEEDERVATVRKIASRFIEGCENKKHVIPSFADGLRVQELIDSIRHSQIV